jgi:hypothetical protein
LRTFGKGVPVVPREGLHETDARAGIGTQDWFLSIPDADLSEFAVFDDFVLGVAADADLLTQLVGSAYEQERGFSISHGGFLVVVIGGGDEK